MAEGDIAAASGSIQAQSVELAAAFNKHVALEVASVNLYARGDPSSSGASWLGDCPNDEWTDWDDLAEQWKRTLKKMKTGTVMQGIEAMKALKDKAADLETLVGRPGRYQEHQHDHGRALPHEVDRAIVPDPREAHTAGGNALVCPS